MRTDKVPDHILDPVTGIGPSIKQRIAERSRVRADLENAHPGWTVQSTEELGGDTIAAKMIKAGEVFYKSVWWSRQAYAGRQYNLNLH